MANAEIVERTGQQFTKKLALLWVRIVITMVYSITLQRYVEISETTIKTLHFNRANSLENHENIENSDEHNVNTINHNEQHDSHHDSYDDIYVAMIGNNETNPNCVAKREI